jgi:hypothetical protein
MYPHLFFGMKQFVATTGWQPDLFPPYLLIHIGLRLCYISIYTYMVKSG